MNWLKSLTRIDIAQSYEGVQSYDCREVSELAKL